MPTAKADPQLPETLRALVKDLDRPVSIKDVESYGKLREIEDRSHRLRSILKAWKDQQTQDRKLREKYAHYLIIAMAVQAVFVNLTFILLGLGVLAVEAWTARTFIAAVFAEIAALVLLVVKYLFSPSGDARFSHLNGRKSKQQRRRSKQP